MLWAGPPAVGRAKAEANIWEVSAMASYVDVIQSSGWTWKSFVSSTKNAQAAALALARQTVLTQAYPNIAPAILTGSNAEGIAFLQALFLIAQALSEQSQTVGNPSAFGNRIFNMQVENDEIEVLQEPLRKQLDEVEKPGGVRKKVPVPGHKGVYIRKVSSPEIKDGKRVDRTSPFFCFDSVGIQVSHFLRRLSGDAKYFLPVTKPNSKVNTLKAKYPQAFKELKDPKSTVDTYTSQLQAAGYSSSGLDYGPSIHNNYWTVLGDFIQMIDKNKAAVITAAAAQAGATAAARAAISPQAAEICVPDADPDAAAADPAAACRAASDDAKAEYQSILDTMKAQAQAAQKATPPKW
jgi:hypothetical protein